MHDKPWIKSYPPGVRWDAEIPLTPVQQILEESASKWPNNPAIDFMGRKISYSELDDLANRAANGLQKLGVKPGVHVGLYLPNTPHYLVGLFGVLKAGGTVVNYSPLDAAKVLEHKIEDSRTDFLITLDVASLYPQMAAMLGKTRLKKLIVGNLGEMSAQPDAVNAQMLALKQLSSVPNDDRHIVFQALLNNDGNYRSYPIADLTAATSQCIETTRTDPPTLDEGKERVLAVLPPFHIYALTVNMLLGIRIGAELVLHTRFDVEAVVKDLTEKKITAFPGVPTMFVAVLNYPGAAKADLSSLKWCNSGGAPLPLEVQQSFEKLTGCRLAEGWGMTET